MIPSLTNTGDFQEFREAQTGKDSEEQLVWKGVPRNTWKVLSVWLRSMDSHKVLVIPFAFHPFSWGEWGLCGWPRSESSFWGLFSLFLEDVHAL